MPNQFPDKVSKSGVMNIGLNNHKATYLKPQLHLSRSHIHETVEARQLKDSEKFAFWAIFEKMTGSRYVMQ